MAIKQSDMQTVIAIARELAMKAKPAKVGVPSKVCACGAKYFFVPAEAKIWDYEPAKMWLWQCSCKSHLVLPADQATANQMKIDMLPTEEAFNDALDGCMDRYKEEKERAIIEEDHANWWDLNKPEDLD